MSYPHDVSEQRTTMLALLAFALVSIAVKLTLVVPLDRAVEALMQQHIAPLPTTVRLMVTQLASTGFVSVVTVLSAVVLASRKSGYWLGRLALSVPGCLLLNELLKYLFHRHRPTLPNYVPRLFWERQRNP